MSQPPPPPPGAPPPPPPPPPEWGGQRATGVYAGFWIRFGAWFIDSLILSVVNALVRAATGQVAGLAIGVLIAVTYSTYFIGSPSGQTVGMRALSIRVIDAQGYGRVDFGRCVIRYLVALVSGLACGLGYLWMLWDPQRQTWHDKAAGTIVVPTSEYPVDRWPG